MNKTLLYFIAAAIFLTAAVTSCKKDNVQTFTVTFDSDGGSEPPEAQKVDDGKLATKPEDPTKDNDVAGLYVGTAPENYVFEGWYDGETLWNFANHTVTGNVALKAGWSLSKSPVNLTGADNIVTRAVNYAKANPAQYTLLLDANVTTANHIFNVANVQLTLIGIGEPRTISFGGADNERIFRLNAGGVSLTLGQNITLLGLNSLAPLVEVQNGSLTMLDGSKITGHHTVNSVRSAVYVFSSDARFTMEGGEISGNSTTSTGSEATAVFISTGATFVMSGGSIEGNTSCFINPETPADVYVSTNCTFELSGDAQINTLCLGATPWTDVYIFITGAYSGKVDNLHLGGTDNNLDNVIDRWTNSAFIFAGTEYVALQQSDIDKFTLGEFWLYNHAQPIAGNTDGKPNFRISFENNEGVLRKIQ